MYASRSSERGTALVIAVMALLAIMLMATWFLFATNQETRMSGASERGTRALQVAEAGVEEALQHLTNGDIPNDPSHPHAVSQIYMLPAGSLPIAGSDTTNIPTAQDLASALKYTVATKGPDVLTVRYKTTANGNTVMRYRTNASPQINTVSGSPIYQIVSTGKVGTAAQTVMAEVCKAPATVLARAAVMADVGIDFNGNISVCGHDHSADTPVWTRTPECNAGMGNWLGATAHGSCVAGGWSAGDITIKGSGDLQGEPDTTSHRTGFYNGPWEALQMDQGDFWSWMGSPLSIEPNPPVGINYLDNNGVKQDGSGNFQYHGGDGEGFLYCDGDLTVNGDFTFKGLVYVEGDLKINGKCWILGALIVHGKTTVKLANGDATILYSSAMIEQALERYGRRFARLSWRVLPR